jgi:hypothetical protein
LRLHRLADEASEEERSLLGELIRQYAAKDRCSVFPENGIEYYLLPKSGITSALLEAAHGGELPPDNLLVVAVHAKVSFPRPDTPRVERP